MKKTLCFGSLVALVAVVLVAAPPPKAPKPPKPPGQGTDILHLFLRKQMTNEGLFTNATGRVDLGLNRQGNAFNQRLDVSVANVPTNTLFGLWAAPGEDTNFVFAAWLPSDRKGRASIRFMKVGSAQGFPGKGKTPLPPALDPISEIRELAVADTSTQAVLSAELRAPDKLQYLIKRTWTDGDATALLRLKATTSKLTFELLAGGLAPATNYLLAVNGAPVESAWSHTNGVVVFTNLPVPPAEVLRVRSVAVWDSASNSVLSTTLP